ncbi:MAG TPA: hypothetical protein PLU26_01480 [Candidatus Competibacter sp.]|nr:hypothetical protein [Candidatus Competibacter sp.]
MGAGFWIDLLSTNPGIAFEPQDGDKGLTQRRQRVAKILAAPGTAVSQLASQQAAKGPSKTYRKAVKRGASKLRRRIAVQKTIIFSIIYKNK